MNSQGKHLVAAIFVATLNISIAYAADLPKVRVSDNNRFLVTGDDTPLIWVGDTLWNWYKLRPLELDDYMDKRVAQGFTVIQTQVAALGRSNYNGDYCFGGSDHKDITDPLEPFWQYSDEWIAKIENRGLYAAVGLSWIVNYWNSHGSAYSTTDLYNYGKWVGNRYKDRNNIIWLSINEATTPGSSVAIDKINAVVNGIRDGDTGNKILTIHPLAGTCTSDDFHSVVDFNSWQTARFLAPTQLPFAASARPQKDVPRDFTVWEAITDDYNRSPVKPVIDLEAWYEGGLNDMDYGGSAGQVVATAWHCRRRAYFTVFAGAFGHTYGAWGLWNVDPNWRDVLDYPGGYHMGHLKDLLSLASRPFLKLVPDQSLITSGQSSSYDSHKQAARASDGSYAYIYSSNGSNFSVDLTRLGSDGEKIKAQWFNPRTGDYQGAGGPYDRITSQSFDPPGSPSSGNDWILTMEVRNQTCQDVIDNGLLMMSDISGPEGNPDCYINLYDFAVFADYWLRCNNPQDPECELIY